MHSDPPKVPRRLWLRALQVAVSLAAVLVIFVLVLPKIASYGAVWKTIERLSWLDLCAVVFAAAISLITFWPQMMAAMPGLTIAQAAVNNQASTTVANIMPGGGAIAIGVAYAMFRSWGYSGSAIALMMSTTGVWNSYMKLFMPVCSLALLAVAGRATSSLLVPALIGIGLLVGSGALIALGLWKERFAHAVDRGLTRVSSAGRRMLGKPPATGFGDRVVTLREQTLELVTKRWPALTLTTVVSHFGLYIVLLLALRGVGVRGPEITWTQVLAVFAFARLLSAAPITPGGIGIVELALIGGLYAAGRRTADVPLATLKTQVTAAVLLFRTLTYGIQIPIGGIAYFIWQHRRSWRSLPVPLNAPLTERR